MSASYGRQRQVDREKEAEQFRRYQLRQHRPDSPDVRYSQPRSEGPHAALAQVRDFDVIGGSTICFRSNHRNCALLVWPSSSASCPL